MQKWKADRGKGTFKCTAELYTSVPSTLKEPWGAGTPGVTPSFEALPGVVPTQQQHRTCMYVRSLKP